MSTKISYCSTTAPISGPHFIFFFSRIDVKPFAIFLVSSLASKKKKKRRKNKLHVDIKGSISTIKRLQKNGKKNDNKNVLKHL